MKNKSYNFNINQKLIFFKINIRICNNNFKINKMKKDHQKHILKKQKLIKLNKF